MAHFLFRNTGHNSRIRLQFTVDQDIQSFLIHTLTSQFSGFLHFFHQLMLGAAFRGKGQESDARLVFEQKSSRFTRGQSDINEFFCGRIDIGATIGVKQHIIAARGRLWQLHNKRTAGHIYTVSSPHTLKSGPQHISCRGNTAADETVCESFPHHQIPENQPVVYRFFRLIHRDPFVGTSIAESLCKLFPHVTFCIVNHINIGGFRQINVMQLIPPLLRSNKKFYTCYALTADLFRR